MAKLNVLTNEDVIAISQLLMDANLAWTPPDNAVWDDQPYRDATQALLAYIDTRLADKDAEIAALKTERP